MSQQVRSFELKTNTHEAYISYVYFVNRFNHNVIFEIGFCRIWTDGEFTEDMRSKALKIAQGRLEKTGILCYYENMPMHFLDNHYMLDYLVYYMFLRNMHYFNRPHYNRVDYLGGYPFWDCKDLITLSQSAETSRLMKEQFNRPIHMKIKHYCSETDTLSFGEIPIKVWENHIRSCLSYFLPPSKQSLSPFQKFFAIKPKEEDEMKNDFIELEDSCS